MEDFMYELGIGEYADMDPADYYDMMSAAGEYDDEDEYDDDGQPSEMEEWLDFDPDC